MPNEQLLAAVINLKIQDRFVILEGLLKSLDYPDNKIDEIWLVEAEKRLIAHRSK